jgi:hypothetical protein
MRDFFVDRFANLNIADGVARLDFVRVENINAEKKQVTMSPSLRLALPFEAFMQMAEQFAKVRDEIIKKNNEQAAAAVGPEDAGTTGTH